MLGNVLVTHNSVHCGVYSGEILVVILVQSIRLGNCCINISVVGRLDALQGKGSSFIISTIIFVCNGVLVTIHCQRVSTYCPTAPIACLGNVEVSRQGGKVKCAVIANNDLVDIIITIQFIHICVADIQRGQLVLVAVQISQRRILADIQRCQLVVSAVQISQRRILADIQSGQLAASAVQTSQCRILADIQRGQLVATAVQISQCRILADIQRGQLVVTAVQRTKCCKVFNAFQIGDTFVIAINFFNCCDFCIT